MINQINPPIGVVSYIQGHVTVKSGGEIHDLKMGDVIHREDIVNIMTDQGNIKVLMVDGTTVNIEGKLPFDFHDYLLIENDEAQNSSDQHKEHQDHQQVHHQPTAEDIQQILQQGIKPEVISDAINACIPLDKPINDNHGLEMTIVPIVESLDNYITISTQQPISSIEILPVNVEVPKSIEPPSSEFPSPAAESNLVVTETVSDPNPADGEIIVYTITANNIGNGDAQNVVITDVLPGGINFISAGEGGVVNNGVVTWNAGTLPAGGYHIFHFTAQVTDPSLAEVVNVASASTTSNNTPTAPQSVTIDPVSGTDLSVINTIHNVDGHAFTNQTIYDGDTVVLAVTATNNGPENATGVNINDLLPSGLSYISDNSGGAYNSLTGTWNINNLANASSETLLITARVVDPSLAPLSTTAMISANQIDPNTANNTSLPMVITPMASADLAVTASVDNTAPVDGTDVTFTISAQNNGPDTATGVQVEIGPTGSSVISVTPTDGTYDSTTGIWSIGDLVNGEIETLTITQQVNLPASTSEDISLGISGNEHDPVSSNNAAAVITVTPTASTDLVLSDVVDNASPYSGQTINYTVQVTNNGVYPASNVNVSGLGLTDSNISFISDTASAGTSYDSGTGIWNIGTLGIGTTDTLTISASVNFVPFQLGYEGISAASPLWFDGSYTGLYAYTFGSSFTDSNGAIDTSAGNQLPIQPIGFEDIIFGFVNGFGVQGGASTTSELESNNSGQTEALVADLGKNSASTGGIKTSDYAIITISGLENNPGSQGELTAYNSAGQEVGAPVIFQETNSNLEGSTTVTISPGTDFQYLAFTALPSLSGGISSYYLENISYLPDPVNNTATVTTDTLNLNSMNTASTSVHLEVPVAVETQIYQSPSDTAYSGNLFSGTGNSLGTNTPGYIQSVAVMGDGYTYAFDGVSTITQEGSGSSDYTFSSGQLSIDIPYLGTFSINLNNPNVGAYSFAFSEILPNPIPYDLPIQFTLVDNGNNQATGMLTLTDINMFDTSNNNFTYTGTGSDILEFTQNSGSVNLSGNTNISNIGELLFNDNNDSTGTALTLTANDVFDFTGQTSSGNNNTLFINGNANDTVHIGTIGAGGWTDTGAASGYEVYTQTVNGHNVTLEVQQNVHVVA